MLFRWSSFLTGHHLAGPVGSEGLRRYEYSGEGAPAGAITSVACDPDLWPVRSRKGFTSDPEAGHIHEAIPFKKIQ
jgi:hypothetical protein